MFGKKYKNMAKISDIFQKFIMSNPKRAIEFMTSMPDSFWEKQGEKMALKTFHETAEKVPAYKDFLLKHGIKDHTKIKTIEDFKKYVPIMNKKNYLNFYPIEKLTQGKVTESYILTMSGGTTDEPLYFLSDREGFKTTYPLGMSALLDYLFDICNPSKKVLLINAVSLGIWAGGVTGILVYKSLCDKFPNISMATPGADPERVIDILEKVGKFYNFIFIAAYPTLLKTIFDAGDKRKIKWEDFNIKLGIGGELTDNSLYDYFVEKISPKKRDLYCIFDVYSGTEIGNPGISTPLTIKIKEFAKKNDTLRKIIFDNKEVFGLFQSNPVGCYVESIGDTLVVTKGGKMPIIRYDTQDLGKLFTWKEMNKILESQKINIQEELKKDGWKKPHFKWPFLTLVGRKDYAISLFGAKITPESIQNIFGKDPKIHSFKLASRDIEDLTPRFIIFLELQPSVKLTKVEEKKLENYYSNKILTYLLKINFDFKDAYDINKEVLTPKIRIYSFREGPFKEEKDRIKPKLIL
jgi:phenylacetate-CoA ligase